VIDVEEDVNKDQLEAPRDVPFGLSRPPGTGTSPVETPTPPFILRTFGGLLASSIIDKAYVLDVKIVYLLYVCFNTYQH
jgi:hypothetical protein